MIEDRPEAVDARQDVGHYEGEIVQGASFERACVVTVVERVTGLLLVGKSPDRTVRSVNKVLQRRPCAGIGSAGQSSSEART